MFISSRINICHKILWPHKDRFPRTSGGEEKERQTEETMDRQCRGMDGKTICRDTGTGTQPQQMEETAAQLVRTASRRLHGELKERGNARIPKMSDGPFLSGIPRAVISYLFPISCVESRGCHFIPFSCLLSGFSA